MSKLRIVSADSHVGEPEYLWAKFLDPQYRDRAPHYEPDGKGGETYVIPGHRMPVPISTFSSAGKDPKELKSTGMRSGDVFPGAYDGKARIAVQEMEGLAGEILYPSVGMVISSHDDKDYKRACFRAYNRWISEDFCSSSPNRLFSVGQIMLDEDIDRVLADMREIKEARHVGLMLTAEPETWPERDFDDPLYDPVWEAAGDMNLPVSLHVLPGGLKQASRVYRGKHVKLMSYLNVVRQNQDLISLFAYTGVFQRHPKLRLVSVEADAGWMPHLLFRMEHAYKFGRHWMKAQELERNPSDYVREQVYVTHQDDLTAFRLKNELNIRRVMWATDFPHMDSTYPKSMQTLRSMTDGVLNDEELKWVVEDNVSQLYGLNLAA